MFKKKKHTRDVTLYMSSYFKKRTLESIRCSQNSWTCSNQEPYPTTREKDKEIQLHELTETQQYRCSLTWNQIKVTRQGTSQSILTLVIHKAPAELLEGSPVAHGPERAVELVVGHHQVFRVTSHVDHLEQNHNNTLCRQIHKISHMWCCFSLHIGDNWLWI